MDRDDFIIAVYCLVCEHYKALCAALPHRLRRGGFAPQLSDEEVITIELCGEYFKLGTDDDLFAHFRAHYQAWFPHLRDRTLFVRQAANLWQVKALIQQRLTRVSGQARDPVQVIDTLPLPGCTLTRGRATAVSNHSPITAIVRPKICTTTASSWACAWRARG